MIIMAALAIGIIASLAVDNMIALTVLTAVLVLSALGLAAIYSAQTLSRLFGRLRGSKF